MFDKQTSAKLKNQKALIEAGDFLSENDFGVAVVVAYTSREGDTAKDLVLTEGRALVVREYLVENFSFDDTRLKTLGMGKKSDVSPPASWGAVQIVVYPPGTEIPRGAQPPNASANSISSGQTSPDSKP